MSDVTLQELDERVTRLEGLSPVHEQIMVYLRRIEAQLQELETACTSNETEILNLRNKFSILAMQIDPVLAGTTRTMQFADDTEISTSAATYLSTPSKSGRIVRTQYFYFSKLYLDVELKVTGGGRGYVALYINGEKKAEAYTSESTYTRVGLTWDWTGLDDNTWYSIEYRFKATGGGTVHNKGLQLVTHKPGASGA